MWEQLRDDWRANFWQNETHPFNTRSGECLSETVLLSKSVLQSIRSLKVTTIEVATKALQTRWLISKPSVSIRPQTVLGLVKLHPIFIPSIMFHLKDMVFISLLVGLMWLCQWTCGSESLRIRISFVFILVVQENWTHRSEQCMERYLGWALLNIIECHSFGKMT